MYGGLTELGVVEVTLDDCWSIDLNKRDMWKKVLPGNSSLLFFHVLWCFFSYRVYKN